MSCGEICSGCQYHCGKTYDETNPFCIECITCGGNQVDGDGKECNTCRGIGYIEFKTCPRQVIGSYLTQCVNMFGFASQGQFPNSGGLLDQDAWFIDALICYQSDVNAIEREQMKRRRHE